MKRTPTSLLALGLVATLSLACAEPAEDGPLTGGGPATPVSSGDPAAVADQAVVDVTAFWEQTYPDVYGTEFEQVAGFYPYGPGTAQPPCGSPPPQYEMIADNAFYCPGDDIIAWDEHALMPWLDEQFGSFTVAIVIAHEFGHAVQDRVGTFDRTVDLELQADCFAGAWTGRVADGDAQGFDPEDVNLDMTVAGMLAIRDVPGTSADDEFAHGSGFDRVAAFQDGYDNGAAKCAEYADPNEDRLTAEIEFRTTETDGNFPLEDAEAPDGEGLLTLLEKDLNDFYGRLLTDLGTEFTPVDDLVLVDPASGSVDCGGESLSGSELDYAAFYCQDENVVVLDGTGLVNVLNDEIGDFAVASEVARLWAIAAQSQLGVVDAEHAALQADCLTGRWAAWTFPTEEDGGAESEYLAMSAGDLDEGIQAFLAYGTGIGDDGNTVFERTAALRTGFFGSHTDCEEYGPLG